MFRVPDNLQIEIPQAEIEAFCRQWQIVRLELFGSVLRDDFRPDSDVDVLVTFADGAPWSLFDLVDMKEQLQNIFGRSVDILTRRSIEKSRNPYRRQAILDSTVQIYEG